MAAICTAPLSIHHCGGFFNTRSGQNLHTPNQLSNFKPIQNTRKTRQEALDVVAGTVGAALAAAVPPGVTRTVYLCDDGKDPKKAAFVATLGPAAR